MRGVCVVFLAQSTTSSFRVILSDSPACGTACNSRGTTSLLSILIFLQGVASVALFVLARSPGPHLVFNYILEAKPLSILLCSLFLSQIMVNCAVNFVISVGNSFCVAAQYAVDMVKFTALKKNGAELCFRIFSVHCGHRSTVCLGSRNNIFFRFPCLLLLIGQARRYGYKKNAAQR